MTRIRIDSNLDDDARRERLYCGDIFLYAPRESTRALCDFAAEMCREAFAPLDPETAQYEMPVEDFAALLAKLKPEFIHHPESKRLITEMLRDFDCDPHQTHFDVPRMRTSTSDGYLTTGIAYAFHPHRDTWYSAPMCQLNWWLPIHELADNGMNFYPGCFDRAVKNGSANYDYQEWNRSSRFDASKHIGRDTRVQPKAEEEIDLVADLRPEVEPGGLMIFSGAQLHGSLPNQSGRTRFSIDFRTVHADDAVKRRGARNIDSACTGTPMADYLRCTDLAHLPQAVIDDYLAVPSQPTPGGGAGGTGSDAAD